MAQKTIFEVDLLSIVGARKHATFAAATIWVFIIVAIIAGVNGARADSPLMIAINLASLGAVVWVIVATILLQVTMGIGVTTMVVTAIATLILPFIIPLGVISQASTILKLAGAKTGFAGMSQSEREKITPGHCRGCGYSREGIGLLDPCPECTRVPQVI